jgi:hypothetical protein
LEIEYRNLLALGGDQSVCCPRQCQGVSAPEFFAGWNGVADRNAVGLQKLGGFRAGASAFAMIIPIDLGTHIYSFSMQVMRRWP